MFSCMKLYTNKVHLLSSKTRMKQYYNLSKHQSNRLLIFKKTKLNML